MSIAFQVLFLLLLVIFPGVGIASAFTAGKPWYIRAWMNLLCSVFIAFVLFLASGISGAMPTIAGWLH